MKATVTSKGQVTLPAALRRKLGIQQGTVLEFEEVDGELRARKEATNSRRTVYDYLGLLANELPSTVEEFMEDLRGPVDLPPEDAAR
jgi:AbrB family looped-hinge helix DNA binding protein